MALEEYILVVIFWKLEHQQIVTYSISKKGLLPTLRILTVGLLGQVLLKLSFQILKQTGNRVAIILCF